MKVKGFIKYVLFAPIVGIDVPERLKTTAMFYRIAEVEECFKNRMATEFEALIAIFSASKLAPLDETWFRIYVYLFRKFFPAHAEKLKLPKITLNEYELHKLNELRKDIFKKQIEALRNNGR